MTGVFKCLNGDRNLFAEDSSALREDQSARGSVEKSDAEVGFKLSDVPRYRGRLDFEVQCRLAEAIIISGTTKCARSEEHTSELQSIMRISYAGFCLKKK